MVAFVGRDREQLAIAGLLDKLHDHGAALAALELLTEAAGDSPLLVIADDAQWLGSSSDDALAHLARRVGYDPIIVLVSKRDGDDAQLMRAGLPAMHLPAPVQDPSEPALPEPLTKSETRVLRYLPTNLTAPEIASELTLSVHTVRTHIRHLYEKLVAHSRSGAVERARALGLLAPASR